jgi:hypothetical protein
MSKIIYSLESTKEENILKREQRQWEREAQIKKSGWSSLTHSNLCIMTLIHIWKETKNGKT